MQIGLKTGVLVTLTLLGFCVQAEEKAAVSPEPTENIVSDKGHVEGYFSLSLTEDNAIDATYLAAKTAQTHGKVLLLHDSSGGIDSFGLIHLLRRTLPEYGWTTMTVALSYPGKPEIYLSSTAASEAEPSLDTAAEEQTTTSEDDSEEALKDGSSEPEDSNLARIGAALTYLDAQQPGPLVIVAVGNAAPLAEAVRQQMDDDSGVVWIAPEIDLSQEPENRLILDIAVSTPALAAKQAEDRRVWMLQNQQEGYSQRSISGAAYGFYGFEETVLAYVRGWLAKQFVKKDAS